MAVTTYTLLKRLQHGDYIQKTLQENEDAFLNATISEYLTKLCQDKDVLPSKVIKKAQIDRTYGYQIFNGTRTPSRDKIIMLAFGFSLSLEETQKLLKVAQKSVLYPKIKRDAVCIFAISKHMNVMQLQELLSSVDLPLLGEM